MNELTTLAGAVSDPLSFAVGQRDRDVLTMVERAVASNNVLLAFQPVVTASSQATPAFYEGLIRLLDTTGRVIPAREFIDHIEARELGRQVDCLALDHGLQSLRRNPDLRISINMSARSIGYPRWTQLLEAALLADPGIGERLILEVTERSAILMPDLVSDFMLRLQAKGISFALDDFGAGYTSLRYLKDLYFDILKIDGQFVRNIAGSPDNRALVGAMIGLAGHFGMLTTAESVETAEDAACLTSMGVDCLQGYHFGAPSVRPDLLACAAAS